MYFQAIDSFPAICTNKFGEDEVNDYSLYSSIINDYTVVLLMILPR